MAKKDDIGKKVGKLNMPGKSVGKLNLPGKSMGKLSGRRTGSPLPNPVVAAARDFVTGKTGMGSGNTSARNRPTAWQQAYNSELSRLKRNAATSSGMGSGRPMRSGSEGPKSPKRRLPGTK
jgi:hypothetical protein